MVEAVDPVLRGVEFFQQRNLVAREQAALFLAFPGLLQGQKALDEGRVAAGVQQVAAKLEYAAFGHGRHVHPSRTSPLYPA